MKSNHAHVVTYPRDTQNTSITIVWLYSVALIVMIDFLAGQNQSQISHE